MKLLWTLLAVVVVLFSGLPRTITSEWPDTDDGVVEDRSSNDDFNEFEDKIIRTWIEHFINKYYKNIQSSTKSANIQRIAKKSRMSTSSAIPILKYRNTAPLPVYPVFFKPYYPPMYSSYIPMSHSSTTHLIPISQGEYYQRFLAPLSTNFPYGYPHFPDTASSTPLNNHLKVKKPFNVQVYTPEQNKYEVQNYDKPEEILIDAIKELSNQNSYDFGQTLPVASEEPDRVDNINENLNPTRDGKLLDNVDNLPKPVTTQLDQTAEFQENQHYLPSNTTNKLNTSTSQDQIVFSERYDMHFTSTSKSSTDKSDSLEILNGIVSQNPPDVKYPSSDKLSTTTRFSSIVSTTTLNPSSSISNTDQSETVIEQVTPTNSDNYFDKERSNIEEKNRQSIPRNTEHGDLSLNGTTGISKPLIEAERKTAETAGVTQSTETFNTLFTSSPRPTTVFRSTTFCEDNDCQGLKSSHLTTPSTQSMKTTLHINVYDTSIPIKTIDSSTQSTNIDSKYENQTNLVSASNHPSLSSTTILETTAIPHKTSTLPTAIKLSSPTTQEISSSFRSTSFKMPGGQTNKTEPTSLHITSSTTRSQPLDNNNLTTPTVIVSKIKQTHLTTMSGNNNSTNMKRDTNDAYNKSTMLSSTATVSSLPTEPIIKTDQIIVPLHMNNSSVQQLIQIQTTIDKVDTSEDDKTDRTVPVTVRETIKSTLKPIASQIKSRSPTPRTSIVTMDGSKYRKSTPNWDRYMAETTQSSQTTRDSDLWYSHVNIQNPHKKELNEQEIDYLLKKLIKLLKPEIERQSLTNDSISRFITPKIGNREKFVYIIFPMIRDAAINMNNEGSQKSNISSLKNADKK